MRIRTVLILLMVAGAPACSGSRKEDAAVDANRSHPAADSGGCGTTSVAEVQRVIDSTLAKADEALRRGDPESLWGLYAEDAIFMWDNQPMWRGKAVARREAPKALGDRSFKEHHQTTEDLIVCGDLAVQTGKFAFTMQRRSGEEIRVGGKNLIVWKRQPDRSWRIVRNLGNEDPTTRQ